MKTLTRAEFFEELRAQGVPREHVAHVCPVCKTVQSTVSVARAMGLPPDGDEVAKYIGFSCIGRFTDAGPHKKDDPPGGGCDWTLGGLLRLHELEVITEDGQHHMRFMPATPEQAKALMAEQVVLEPQA